MSFQLYNLRWEIRSCEMKNKSIMFWVVITLVVIGVLPFLLSWYQIKQSRTAVVDQAQKNHLIISRATADRFETYLEKYQNLALNLANNPNVYLEPDSQDSTETIKSGLLLQDDIQLIALVHRLKNDSSQIIQLARKNVASEIDVNNMINQTITFQLVSHQNQQQLVINTPSARPFVDVMMLVNIDFTQWLNPRVLGQAASLSLVDSTGKQLAHSGDPFQTVPTEWLTLFKNSTANGGANRSDVAENQYIAAFAKVGNQPWYVISRQSVAFAEQSTQIMSNTAWKVFALVLLVMAVLLTIAYFSWVKPIRRIIKSQNVLMGETDARTDWDGGEVQALEKSFEVLTKHINDRNALGQVFVDRYQVISPIGKGGMGSVFLGWDPKLDRHVALKTLPIGNAFESRENMSQTLVQEAITAARISHRNVVSIYDVVSTKHTAFIAMEYIKGESLSSLLLRKKVLNLPLALSIGIAVLRGLQTAHKLGFVHRDIKPANILLDVNGDIKITDFGTTTMVSGIESDSITGTHGYMAPETYLKGEVTIQSDLFAVGVVIVECLLGKNPFKAKKAQQTKYNTINSEVKFPANMRNSESEKLFTVLDLLLDKKPERRPKSASVAAEFIVQTAPGSIKWDAEVAGVKIQKSESNYGNEETIVNLSQPAVL